MTMKQPFFRLGTGNKKSEECSKSSAYQNPGDGALLVLELF